MDPSQIELETQYNAILERRAELLAQTNSLNSNQAELSSQTNSILRDRSRSSKKYGDSQGDLAGQLDNVAGSQEKANEGMSLGSKISEMYTKTMESLRYGYDAILKPMKTFYDFISMKGVYDSLISAAADYSGKMREGFEATQALKAVIGDLAGPSGERYNTFVKGLSRSTGALAKSGKNLGSVFGIGVGSVMKGVTDEISKMGVAFDATMDALAGAEGEFMLLNKGLGISSEALGQMARGSKDAQGDFAEMAVTIASGAKKFGISMKSAGKNVDAALKDVKNFGYMTKKELSETALYATRLGLEMADLTTFGDKFDTFEGAAESVGKLSSAFGIQLDTMDMVMEDNPAKKLDMVRKALEAQGKTMDNVLGDRRQAQYLSDTIGIPIDKLKELQKTTTDDFGFDSLADDMDVEAPMTELDAMKDIAKQMKALSDSFKDLSGVETFFDAFSKGFKKAGERTPAYVNMMAEVSDSLTSFFELGEQVANGLSDLFYVVGEDGVTNIAPLAGIFDGIKEYFTWMKTAADSLMGKDGKGPLTQIFGIIGSVAKGELLDSDAPNIFDLLMGPFMKDNPGQGIFNPKIRKGLMSVATIMLKAVSDAFVFIGTESTKWIYNLLNPVEVDKALDSGEGKQKLFDMGATLIGSFGDMMGSLGEAASGLSAYFVGGSFQGTTIPYEESVIGKMMIAVGDKASGLEPPSMLDKGKGFMLKMVNELFGFEDTEGLDLAYASFEDKQKLMGLKIKKSAVTMVKDLIGELRYIGRAGLATYPGPDDAPMMQSFDLGYNMYKSMAGLKDIGFDASISRMDKQMSALKEKMKTDSDTLAAQAQVNAKKVRDAQEALTYEPGGTPPMPGIPESPENDAKLAAAGRKSGKIHADEFNLHVVDEYRTLEELDALNKAMNNKTVKDHDSGSPSMVSYAHGKNWADGFIVGIFGDNDLLGGSLSTGLAARFAEQMDVVSNSIDESYSNLALLSMATVETKLGQFGEVLSGEKPLSVIVSNEKVEVKLALNVTMDTKDIAHAMGTAEGGSYFMPNTNRVDDSEFFDMITKSDADYAKVKV
jgi:hypothetical protein